MRHPTEGTLRRLVDEPAGVADHDREHVAGCRDCLAGLAAARDDAAAASAALRVDATTDVDAAWTRLSHAASEEHAGTARRNRPSRRWSDRLRSPVAAAVGVVALLAGAGAAAASDWVQIFRTEEIAPVPVTRADLVQLPDLSGYGDLEVVDPPRIRQVADAAAVEEASGISLPRVEELPQGVAGEPSYQVGREVTAVFTFSADKAQRTAAATGESAPPVPDGLDGSQFRLSAGPGAAAMWSSTSGAPALVVARAVAPTAASSGVPFETARDYLLSLPGMSDDLAAQLRAFSGDGTTLPLPVPAGQLESSTAEVDGVSATVLTSRDGTMAGVVWVANGNVTAVAGTLTTDEVLSVARGLQ